MDRSLRNPNLLSWHGQHWLIDHGAALTFQHAESPSRIPRATTWKVTLLASRAQQMRALDEQLARRSSLERRGDTARRVRRAFLEDAFPRGDYERLPHAYAAFLWKRLKAPRPWV
ncbi:MAG: hypothetical protein R3B89_12100 [Polyangiaceae bacterium]